MSYEDALHKSLQLYIDAYKRCLAKTTFQTLEEARICHERLQSDLDFISFEAMIEIVLECYHE